MKVNSEHALSALLGALAMGGVAIHNDIADTPEREISFLRSDLQEAINVTERVQVDLQNTPQIQIALPQSLDFKVQQAQEIVDGAAPSNFVDITDEFARSAAIYAQMSAMCESYRELRWAHLEIADSFLTAAIENIPNFDLSDNPHLGYMGSTTIGELYCDGEGDILSEENKVRDTILELL